MKNNYQELGAVAEFINGVAFKPEDWGDDGQRIIRIQNLTDSSKSYNRTQRRVADKFHVMPGDLLVSWSATLGVFVWDQPDIGILNQHIFRVVPYNGNVDKRYLRYALDAALADMEQHLHGATMKHVNRGEFLATKIYTPSIPEQQRIAAILDAADALREKRRQAIAKLDGLVQAVFVEMFGSVDTIFERWPTKKLGDLLTFLTSGSRGWADYYSEVGDIFLRIQNVRRDELVLDDVAYVEPPATAEAKRTRVQPGDVLLSITADLGRTAVVPPDIGRAYINQHLSILRTTAVEPRFLSAYLASPAGQRQVLGRNRQAVKAGLNFDDIRSFLIPIPPVELQRKFTCCMTAIARQKEVNRASLAHFNTLFLSLQQRAFRGEL